MVNPAVINPVTKVRRHALPFSLCCARQRVAAGWGMTTSGALFPHPCACLQSPVAYKLVPMAHPPLLAQPESIVGRKGTFAAKQL